MNEKTSESMNVTMLSVVCKPAVNAAVNVKSRDPSPNSNAGNPNTAARTLFQIGAFCTDTSYQQ